MEESFWQMLLVRLAVLGLIASPVVMVTTQYLHGLFEASSRGDAADRARFNANPRWYESVSPSGEHSTRSLGVGVSPKP